MVRLFMLQLFCFGAPQFILSPNAIPVELTPRASALLIYLAVTQGVHSRDALADLLWSETNNQQARSNLRYCLPELRHTLGDHLVITTRNLSFNHQAPYWLDVEVLRATLSDRPETIALPALQTALDLYQGEFLAGFTVRNAPVFEAWVVQQREELHALAVQGAYLLADRYGQQADYPKGLAATQRLLQWEPWHEAGHRLQMQLLAASGQRTAALAHYERCRTILADELGVEPEAATSALYEAIRDGAYDKVTGDKVTGDKVTANHPTTQSPSLPHNLPGQFTSFIGRQREVTELCTYVQLPDYRLITLVGEGGIGKTRLALVVAQTILDSDLSRLDNQRSNIHSLNFSDGVWFVPLAGLQPTGDVAAAIAAAIGEALGLRFTGSERLTNQVCAHLRRQRLLLVLDNFEHLLAETDFVLDLLRTAPAVKLLVTSRQRLNFQGELRWRVEGLRVPPATAALHLTAAALAQYESVALFCARARLLERTFDLNDGNRAAVAHLCRLVDGLPLALELAASLIRRYDCAEIVELLQTDYTLLATTQRDVPARHRSLQAVLDDSWTLLSTAEAQILAQCTVFCGGFSCAAAGAITGATLLHLDTLESKSLIQQLRPDRYTLHELVRQSGATRLQGEPALHAQTLARHSAYYLALLCTQGEQLHVEAAAQQRLRLEHDNLLVAWQQGVTTMNFAGLEKSLPYLTRFYRLAGYYAVGLELCQQTGAYVRATGVEAGPQAPVAQRLLAQLLLAQAEFCHNLGRLGEAGDLITEALHIGQPLADERLIAQAAYEMAEVARLRGQFDAAQAAIQRALTLARTHNDGALEVACLNRLGVVLMTAADFEPATACFQAALSLLQAAPDRVMEARLLLNLGNTSFAQYQVDAAIDYNQRARDLADRFGDQRGLGLALFQLGMALSILGEFAQARTCYEQAQVIFQVANMAYFEGVVLVCLGQLWHAGGDNATARQYHTQALEIAQNKAPLLGYWAYTYWGRFLVTLQEFDGAARAYEYAVTLLEAGKQRNKSLDAYAGRAALLLAQNDLAQALVQVEALLPNLQPPAISATIERNWVNWTCYRVLQAAGDPRATAVLHSAYQALLQQAATIQDQQRRRSFLQNVTTNCLLLAEAQAAGISGDHLC